MEHILALAEGENLRDALPAVRLLVEAGKSAADEALADGAPVVADLQLDRFQTGLRRPSGSAGRA
ncbi:hypothetical protein AB656_05125 [Bifidobacterium actinocoloniiforme DSM 22766]|nr:hypothetical protein AB656_05125 [Bifidobacterium actinocoloniiforme DSM 22766]